MTCIQLFHITLENRSVIANSLSTFPALCIKVIVLSLALQVDDSRFPASGRECFSKAPIEEIQSKVMECRFTVFLYQLRPFKGIFVKQPQLIFSDFLAEYASGRNFSVGNKISRICELLFPFQKL